MLTMSSSTTQKRVRKYRIGESMNGWLELFVRDLRTARMSKKTGRIVGDQNPCLGYYNAERIPPTKLIAAVIGGNPVSSIYLLPFPYLVKVADPVANSGISSEASSNITCGPDTEYRFPVSEEYYRKWFCDPEILIEHSRTAQTIKTMMFDDESTTFVKSSSRSVEIVKMTYSDVASQQAWVEKFMELSVAMEWFDKNT